jgi:regulation of enolase protein 1 (concanavalin A-like superfamily)
LREPDGIDLQHERPRGHQFGFRRQFAQLLQAQIQGAQRQGSDERVLQFSLLTDLFTDPATGIPQDNAPVALFTPPDASFLLSAKVAVDFAADFDAGSLQVRVSDDHWGKLCFEYSPQREPMVVSVVTRGASDDCNHVIVDG